MFGFIRRLLIGSPLHSARAMHERLPKIIALPVFASDAMSSSAYATEEILLVLVLAGTSVLLTRSVSIAIAGAIAVLFAIVVTSYRQTIHAYPSGGGAYIVAKDNLGTHAGLIAGSALLVDYVLTVAVSVAAGVAAITSANPSWSVYTVEIGVGLVAFIALANLRGVRESGLLFAVPSYTFVLSALTLVVVGIYRIHTSHFVVPPPHAPIPKQIYSGLPIFLILRAFSSGCGSGWL